MKNPHFVRIQKILGPLVRFLFPISLEGTENLPEDRPVMLCASSFTFCTLIPDIFAVSALLPTA